MESKLTAGDFTGLAEHYSKNRPDYSTSVLNALLGLSNKNVQQIDFADVGAGTGIWTKMVVDKGVKSAVAVEPNDDMRKQGADFTKSKQVIWKNGSAEKTTLAENSIDWLTMASSFHWADFKIATEEFHRVLRPNGLFTALWNPRFIEDNPLLVEIENKLTELNPDIKRVSSGRSGITEVLTDKLSSSEYFHNVVYIEAKHHIVMTTDRYIGAWKSVNDLRVQLGDDKFEYFIEFAEKKVKGLENIQANYLTRAWSAYRRV